MRFLAAIVLAIFCAVPAATIPPPPPYDGALTVAQTFIRAAVNKDIGLYTSLLTDRFDGADAEVGKIMTRADWLADTDKGFQNPWLHIEILKVFYGAHLAGDALVFRIMIVERLSNYPDPPHSDCCTFYRTETLVLDGDKVRRIVRSVPFDTELSITGDRTDLSPR